MCVCLFRFFISWRDCYTTDRSLALKWNRIPEDSTTYRVVNAKKSNNREDNKKIGTPNEHKHIAENDCRYLYTTYKYI